MYVREIKMRRGIGTWDSPLKAYSYYQLVRSYRDPETGKIKKQVVKHLGKWADKETAEWGARTEGYLCGAHGCGQEGVEEERLQPTRRGSNRALLCEDHARQLRAVGSLKLVSYEPDWMANLRPQGLIS